MIISVTPTSQIYRKNLFDIFTMLTGLFTQCFLRVFNELCKFMSHGGIEPPTLTLRVSCSTS